jgi:hypothetical protein
VYVLDIDTTASRHTVTDNMKVPATKVLVSGNTPTIVLQTSTRSSTGSTWLSN